MAAATATISERVRAHCRAFGIAVALVLAGCGRPTPPATPTAHPPKAPASALEYVPSAGLSWLIFGRPARIAADPALSAALASIVPKARLDAYAAATGVELRTVPFGVVAGYELGTLFVAELPMPYGERVRARFASRLSDGGIVKRVRADIYRISGTDADTPLALVSVEDRTVALASGDVTLARIVEAYAERRIKSPTALRGAALSTLPEPGDDVLAAFFAPGPFTRTTLVAAPELFAAALAAGISIRSAAPGMLGITLALSGEWSAEHEPRAELERAWSELAKSTTGRLLGLDSAQNVVIRQEPSLLTLSLDLPIAPLVRGLRALTLADVPEIFDLNNASPQLPTHTDTQEPTLQP